MTPKEISREAGRIFTASIPRNWVIRPQQDQEDYGVDYEIEYMLPGDQPSGFPFKVQEKGALEIEEDASMNLLIFSGLKVARMKYYLRQIDVPIALVLVDVTKKCVWWAALQGNPTAEDRFVAAAAAMNDTMTMHVPKANTLPGTEVQFIEAMRAAQDALTVRCIREAPQPNVLRAALNTDCLDDTAEAFRRHSDSLRVEQVERVRRSGDLASALRVCEAIWSSPSETFQIRFAAAVNMDRIMAKMMPEAADFASRLEFMQRRLAVAVELMSVGKKENAPEHLQLYAGAMHSSAKLSILNGRYFHLADSEHRRQVGETLVPIIRAGKEHTMVLFFREHERGHEFLADLLRKGYRHLVAPAWSLIVIELGAFYLMLRMDGQLDASVRLVNWIDNTVRPIAEAAADAKDWQSVALCAVQQLAIGGGRNPVRHLRDCVLKARELLSLISDESVRRRKEQEAEQRATALAEATTPSYHPE